MSWFAVYIRPCWPPPYNNGEEGLAVLAWQTGFVTPATSLSSVRSQNQLTQPVPRHAEIRR